uniref:Uncharacterized protein n=1 Tax=Solanum lycopersicum TaxID=4081 RepID=K4BVM5_SOLLC
MGWFIGERRGVSWRDQTLESISAPPLALIVLFGLVIFLMSMSTYSEYKATVEKSKANGFILMEELQGLLCTIWLAKKVDLLGELLCFWCCFWSWFIIKTHFNLLGFVYFEKLFDTELRRIQNLHSIRFKI